MLVWVAGLLPGVKGFASALTMAETPDNAVVLHSKQALAQVPKLQIAHVFGRHVRSAKGLWSGHQRRQEC